MNEILLSNTTEVDAEEPEITPYNPAPAYYDAPDDEDDLLQPVDEYEDNNIGRSRVLDDEFKPKRGQRLGNFVCSYCDKSFRYIKAFNTHVKQHKKGEISRGGYKRRYILKKKKIQPEARTFAVEQDPEEEEEEEDQAPYDSLSPYGSPARYEAPAREDSPDFGMMMLNTFHNGDNGSAEPPAKKLRLRKQKLPSRSPSREPTPEIVIPAKKPAAAPSTSSGPRGRGRPRKDQKQQTFQPKQTLKKPNVEVEPSPFADFCEVDVTSMLKKSILDNDSYSQSGPSTTRSRSRSASVELIDDFDIFGSVMPDDNSSRQPGPKSSFGSGTTFACDIRGCVRKFHLRANLKKHQREEHGVK